MPRSLIRKEINKIVKPLTKTPRNGKIFNDTIKKLNDLYKNLDLCDYGKQYLRELTEKYYFKFFKRHKNRNPLNLEELSGGCMCKYIDFSNVEGGRMTDTEITKGENHAYLRKKGSLLPVRANFMGPNTNLIERIKRGDKPVSMSDKTAFAHDILYTLAENLDDIREADNIMNRDLTYIARNNLDDNFNILMGKMIKSKMFFENMGILDRKKFAGDLKGKKGLSKIDRYLLNKKLRELQSEGIGLPFTKSKTKLLGMKKQTNDESDFEEYYDEPIEIQRKPKSKTKTTLKKNKMYDTDNIMAEPDKSLDDNDLNTLLKQLLNMNTTINDEPFEGTFKGRKKLKPGRRF